MKREGVKSLTMMILLAVIVLCLLVLSVLTLSTAAADLRLSEKYAAQVQSDQHVEAQAQSWLAQLDEKRRDGEIEPGAYTMHFGEAASKYLEVTVDVKENAITPIAWQWVAVTESSGMDNLWRGTQS